MLRKVYIIDDDQITLYLTKVTFELFSPDCECVCFSNAMDALERILVDTTNNSLPDLILLDLNMPVMSGFELLKRLEPLDATFIAKECFVFVLTSSVDEQDRFKSLNNSLVADLIEKPFSNEKLEEIKKKMWTLKLSLN